MSFDRVALTLATVFAMATGGCTANSVAVPSTETDTAFIEGPVVFVSIDGQAPEKAKRHAVVAGEHEVAILFRSYAANYQCTYEFTAVAGHRYEFVTRSNPGPITLYRLARENWLFWTRHDPVLPRKCVEVER